MEQIAAQLQQLMQSQQAMQENLARLSAENERLRSAAASSTATANTASLDALVAALQEQNRLAATRDRPSIIDSRGIGKPPAFDNRESSFSIWTKKLENFFLSVHSDMEPVLEWSLEQTTGALPSDADLHFDGSDTLHPRVDDVDVKAAQLYTLLAQLTDGESFDIVNNAGKNNGLEAWRKLHRRFDPSTGGRRRNMLREIINPGRCKHENQLYGAMERWEELVQRYERKLGRSLDDDLKMAALESLVTSELEKHLMMNASRLNSYESMREEVFLYIETRTGARMKSEARWRDDRPDDPMDTSSFAHKGGKGKGKDKKGKDSFKSNSTGKGKGSTDKKDKFDGECRVCGKYGHMAKDCWHKDTKNQSSSAGGSGKKGGKSSGKAGGRGKGKPAGSLEEEPEQETGSIELGSCELLAVSCNTAEGEWIKCNYDTGCARSVVPLREGDAVQDGDGTTYRTASGETIEDQGEAILKGRCEHGISRTLRARRADVHKVLVSGAKAAKFQDAWITEGGGYLVPRTSPIAKGMQKELDRLIKMHGDKGLIPLYEENGVYNFYLRREAPPAQDVQRDGGAVASAEVEGQPGSGSDPSWAVVGPRRGRQAGPGFHRRPRA